jgi:AraC-like DNA-binding protein
MLSATVSAMVFPPTMRDTTRLVSGAGFAIDDVRICTRTPSWLPTESSGSFRLVFIRRGVFRLRLGGHELVADPTTAYVARAGEEQSIAHRVGARDASTSVTLSPALVAEFGAAPAPTGPLRSSGSVDLAHRVLYARANRGSDGFELAERVLRLAADALDPRQQAPSAASAGATALARKRVVDAAREALAADPVSLGLEPLAAKVNVSPAYLSRIFHRETGHTLTRFRNRLRVRLVLDRLEDGETNLARLAADLGFADHAHLTRTVREDVGHTPSAVRALLADCPAEHLAIAT